MTYGFFTNKLSLLALAWTAYFVLHSWLASFRVKGWVAQRWPSWEQRYRLAYNLLATLLLVPLLIATELASDHWLWRWQGGWAWAAHAVTLLVVLGFIWSSRVYNMREFLGLAASEAGATPRLGLSPLHRFVRHPWYFLGLVWLWTRDIDSARLVAVLVTSGYLWFGSHLEERKLIEELGTVYRDYRSRVPGLVPRPWRFLSRADWVRLNAAQRPPSSASMT
jgi:protein-S-isoprenylcysteine O-methyltransferase Ste14